MPFIVAIDGPAAAGKGTISKEVAAHFGFAHLDTGLLYRAVGAKVLMGQDPLLAAQSLKTNDLEDGLLRTPEVAQAASQVATRADVRQALVAFQRDFAQRDGGAVLDGRDIGTVICPDADVKLYVTATAECRAKRRFTEMSANGLDVTLSQVLEDVVSRDKRDQERAAAPLIAAQDAILIDTSEMTIADAVAAAFAAVAAQRSA